MSRVGAIDLGTNSFLCLIADINAHGEVQTVLDQVEIVRLGEGVNQSHCFSPTALARAKQTLSRFKVSLDSYAVTKVAAVATSAARDVTNANELFQITNDLNIPLQVIDGLREAELTYKGVLTNPKIGNNVVVIDVGGGSTELTYVSDKNRLSGQSFDVGGVRLTEMFVKEHPILPGVLKQIRDYARKQFTDYSVLRGTLQGKIVVGVAGTPTTLAALELNIEYAENQIEGFRMSAQQIEHWLNKLAALPLQERARLKGLEPKRADIIVAGTAVLLEAMLALGGDQLVISTRGLRFGLARELA